jgi:hypothetical protein
MAGWSLDYLLATSGGPRIAAKDLENAGIC